MTVADPKVEQPTLQRLYLAPSCARPRPRDAKRSNCSPKSSAAGRPRYLYRSSCWSAGIAVNAGAWYMGSAIDDTRFCVYAVPAEGVRWRRSKRRSTRCSATAADEALDVDAIERAKTRLVAETVYASDSQASLARIYGSALAIGETLDDVRRWPAEIEAVLEADLARRRRNATSIARRSVTGYLRRRAGADAVPPENRGDR